MKHVRQGANRMLQSLARQITVQRLVLLATALSLCVLAGCGARTSVTGIWQERKPASLPFEHVLIVGISPRSRVRRSFETALLEAVSSGGTRASASIQSSESRRQLTPAIVATMVRNTGADAVLITRVANRKVSASETKGRTGVKPQQPENLNGGVGLVEFFSLEYKEYEEPAELNARSTAVIETSVYEGGNSGRLLYTLTTTSEFREGRDDVIGDVTQAIAGKLRREGLIR